MLIVNERVDIFVHFIARLREIAEETLQQHAAAHVPVPAENGHAVLVQAEIPQPEHAEAMAVGGVAAVAEAGPAAINQPEPEPHGQCRVCMDRHANVAYIPCGHVFCDVCIQRIEQYRGRNDARVCSVCRQPIQNTLDFYP